MQCLPAGSARSTLWEVPQTDFTAADREHQCSFPGPTLGTLQIIWIPGACCGEELPHRHAAGTGRPTGKREEFFGRDVELEM